MIPFDAFTSAIKTVEVFPAPSVRITFFPFKEAVNSPPCTVLITNFPLFFLIASQFNFQKNVKIIKARKKI